MVLTQSRGSARPRGRYPVREAILGVTLSWIVVVSGCAGTKRASDVEVTFHDPNMDFSQIRQVAVLPFANLTATTQAGDRVRDVFMTMLQASGAFYVIPPGEVARGVNRAKVVIPGQPTADEAVALGKELKAEVLFTGTVREYGEVRSGNTSANVASVSVQMIETQTGKIVWSASSTRGGVSAGDRILGGRGEPMNDVTESAMRDLLDKLFE